jgi:hypothetical protein
MWPDEFDYIPSQERRRSRQCNCHRKWGFDSGNDVKKERRGRAEKHDSFELLALCDNSNCNFACWVVMRSWPDLKEEAGNKLLGWNVNIVLEKMLSDNTV